MYIAQPPLYKIKKGKQEVYVKDDLELTNYLVAGALNKASLYVNNDAPALSGTALESLVQEYMAVEQIFERLASRYDVIVLRALTQCTRMTPKILKNAKALEKWINELSSSLPHQENTDSGIYTATLDKEDSEGRKNRIAIRKIHHGLSKTRYLRDHVVHRRLETGGRDLCDVVVYLVQGVSDR